MFDLIFDIVKFVQSSDREYVTMDEGLNQYKKPDKGILCSHIVWKFKHFV